MRISQETVNRYSKVPDKIQQQLISILQRYFETENEFLKENAETIIREAVVRVREELYVIIKTSTMEIVRNDLKSELDLMIQANTVDIVKDLKDTLMELQKSDITPGVMKFEFELPNNKVFFTNGVKLRMTNEVFEYTDQVFVSINGINHYDFELILDDTGYAIGIDFGSDIMTELDVVVVEYLLMHEEIVIDDIEEELSN